MMAMVDENPLYSRIDGFNYITCLFCDGPLRTLLKVNHDSVKIFGNVVGAASAPIHQPTFNNNQARNFGTNIAQQQPTQPTTSQNRRNWFNNDDNQTPPPPPPRWGNQSTSSNNRNNQNQRPSISNVRCNCNEPTQRLICKKDGPNQNRSFLKCAKGTCKFFQWDDQPGSNSFSGNNNNNNSSNARAPRRCGHCRKVGHSRNNCPNNT